MRRRLMAGALALAAACSGLLTEPGNDFPCDFSQPPGARDAVCSAGDVCGVENRCQRFRYEGPQFEGLPTFPDFSATVDAGRVLHPELITSEVDFVARVQGTDRLVVHSGQGYFELNPREARPLTFGAPGPAELSDVVLLPRANPLLPPVVVGREASNQVFHEGSAGTRVRDGMSALQASRLRSLELGVVNTIGVVTAPSTRLGTVRPAGPLEEFAEFPLATTGPHFDLVPGPAFPAPLSRQRTVVSLSADGLRARTLDGGFEFFPGAFTSPARLAADPSGSVFAVLSARGEPVLSTFTVTRSAGSFEVGSPWSDCTPCLAPLAFTPGRDAMGPFVEVLCAVEGLRRVRGAESNRPDTACAVEEVAPPFDTGRVSLNARAMPAQAVQDFASPSGFIAGGRDGQVWVGQTIGGAVPFFLDRVPQDVAQADRRAGAERLIALTSAGVFEAVSGRGFVALAPQVSSRIVALIGEGQGWVVAADGSLVQVALSGRGGLATRFGPRLIDGRGAPIERALRGEGMTGADGGLVSMVVAADDSLYFVSATQTGNTPGGQGEVSAQLTPEPSILIRSLALERTAIGTNGVDRVRGYVVTSRNVYEFKLGGAPLRWTATPLRLSGAEPLEVWFDNPRGGLARVGYRDGTIFSIPGGFQLVEALPGGDGGVPASVLDYENLGGWPVALTTTGLFVARYDALPTGRLDNRYPDGGLNKPMTWREVTLPDGSRPWLRQGFGGRVEVRGRLHVVAEPQTGTNRAYRQLFRLLLFLPTQVLEVGQHVRTNISSPGLGVPPPE